MTVLAAPQRPKPAGAGRRHNSDAGRAILELIVLGVLVLIPIMYIAVSLLQLQSTTFAATQAARDAARIMDNAPSVSSGQAQAMAAARQTLTDQHVSPEGLHIRYVATGADCTTAQSRIPDLQPGSTYDICVIATLDLPLLPSQLTAANTVTGVFTLHVGEFKEAR